MQFTETQVLAELGRLYLIVQGYQELAAKDAEEKKNLAEALAAAHAERIEKDEVPEEQ